MHSTHTKYKEFAVNIALRAGDYIATERPSRGDLSQILSQPRAGSDLKTRVDLESDRMIRATIEEVFPDHSIISEESEAKVTDSPYRWVVDSLDGTRAWLYRMSDHFAVSIALEHNGHPVLGVINAPALNGGSLYVVEIGCGATLNGERIAVSSQTEVDAALVTTDYGKEDKGHILELERKIFGNANQVDSLYKLGGASVECALVASGNLDAALMYGLDIWDLAAAKVILAEAGATISCWPGLNDREVLLASNAPLHDKLLALLEK